MNGKIYRIVASKAYDGDGGNSILYWFDITTYENLKTIYKEEKYCFGYIQVDNYDDLIGSSPAEKKSMVAAQIEKAIRQWAMKINASLTKFDDDQYLMIFENKNYEKLEENKFGILDEVREIETDADFPVSLSIGIGIGGKTPQQQAEYAQAALDLALGRGGDQAVVKKINKVEYFGGRLQAVEKRNKGKSKIMAHALKQLVDQSSRVIIMGHKKPDMDSFGSSLGIYRIARNKNRDAYILINSYNEALQNIYKRASDTGNYNFINTATALTLIDKDTLLVVVDTHRPSFTECPELLSKTEKIVVIDHHRKTEENIENATLSYMEAYASSTAELITEIMQYVSDKREIDKFEAEALLAGIAVDTKSFSVKTGVRTFEAASWLRRSGADLASVKQFFQNDMEMYKLKSDAIINARIIKGGVAISKCEGIRTNMHLITSQAADELLNIKGIKAAFVAGRTDDNTTAVSARSLGELNVQLIMEKMGGGGHLTMAGGQMNLSVEDTLNEIEKLVKESSYIKIDGIKK
jgi:c-di-AMP phosphodiesterase-like protein